MTLKDKVKNIPPAERSLLIKKYEEKGKRGEEVTFLDVIEVYLLAEHYSDPNRYSPCSLPPPEPTLMVSPRAFVDK